MLAVNALTKDTRHFSSHGMPPVIEIPLNLDGLYSIYFGMPLLDLSLIHISLYGLYLINMCMKVMAPSAFQPI